MGQCLPFQKPHSQTPCLRTALSHQAGIASVLAQLHSVFSHTGFSTIIFVYCPAYKMASPAFLQTCFFLSIQYRFVWNALLPFTDGNIYPIQLSLSDISHHVQEAAFIETVRQYQEGHSMGIRHLLQDSHVPETDAVISVFHSWCIQAWKTSWAIYIHAETAADVQYGRLKLLHRVTEKEEQHERHNRNCRTSAKKIFLLPQCLPYTAPGAAVHWLWKYTETDSCWTGNSFTRMAGNWQHKTAFLLFLIEQSPAVC